MTIVEPDWYTPPTIASPQVGEENALANSRFLRPGGAVDKVGLVSATGFTVGSVNNAVTRSISTSSTYTDINDTSITTISLPRACSVLITYTINARASIDGGATLYNSKAVLNIDGVDQTGTVWEVIVIANTSFSTPPAIVIWGGPLTASAVISLGSGTHTLKLRGWTINTNSTMHVDTTSLYYMVLGT
jgi:hypothetical protein